MTKENITFESEGLVIAGFLVLPDSGVADTGVTCVTGGETTAEAAFSDWQEHMATEGVASLAFDARGKGGSEGYWSSGAVPPVAGRLYNSQRSRMLDTIQAVKILRQNLGQRSASALIGASMGGDIALRAEFEMGWRGRGVDALVLKGPAAYQEAAHTARYGLELKEAINDAELPPTSSANFAILRYSMTPTMLIYARGDETIPSDLQERYEEVITAIGGEVLKVGDETTCHKYFAEEDEVSKSAKQETIERSTQFILKHCSR